MDPDTAWQLYLNRPKSHRNDEFTIDAEGLEELLANPANGPAEVFPVLLSLIRGIEFRTTYYQNAPFDALDTIYLDDWPDPAVGKATLWSYLHFLRGDPLAAKGLLGVLLRKTAGDHPG